MSLQTRIETLEMANILSAENATVSAAGLRMVVKQMRNAAGG